MVVIDMDLGLSHLIHNFAFGYNIFQWLAILIRYLNELSLADLIYLHLSLAFIVMACFRYR